MHWLLYIAAILLGVVLLWKFLKFRYPWLSEDLVFLKKLATVLKNVSNLKKQDFRPCDKLQEQAQHHPNWKFILYEDEVWTYQQVHIWANKCARAFNKIGISPGDKIGLFMYNEPAYAALWMGCNRVGAVAGFLNSNLRLKSLLHCIDIAEVNHLIVGSDSSLVEAIKEVEDELRERNMKLFVYGPGNDLCWSFSELVDREKPDDIPYEWRGNTSFLDPICYIYTSGTTGLPKAINVSSNRAFIGGEICGLCNLTTDDVIYTALPLYHSAASLLGFCGALVHGCAILLRKKFSASHFWSDCRKHNVTIVQYIGETMRYVCKQPTTPEDRNHKVRVIIGNGLRPDVWRTFLDRYGKDIHVMELYAATEGNASFINVGNKFGCIGTFSPLMQAIGRSALIKFNPITEEIIKDSNGHAICASVNEPGLIVGKISESNKISPYKGQQSLTEKKILRNLFKDGDKYFNTGDLLMFDKDYKLYFCDRVGDTFRWKGENVSTNEVSDTIVQSPGVKESNVYGVEVPGQEGRVGMAALVLEDDFDWKVFYKYVCDSLPSYARPAFIRIVEELELTGTLKQRKVNLKLEGFDLKKVTDKIFFLDLNSKSYVPLTEEIKLGLEDGTVRI